MAVSPIKDPDALPQLVGDFQPVDIWQTHINNLFYGLRGSRIREYYQTFAVADFRLGFALAEDYWRRCRKRAQDRPNDDSTATLTVMEWGAGNGNLAACFLDRLQEVDTEHLIVPRVRYLCIEREPVLLEQAKANPDLARHRERVIFDSVSVEDLSGFPDGSIDRIICNELWSELPTKLLIRKEGEIQEEQLRPNLNEKRLTDFPDWSTFVEAFDRRDVDVLKTLPSFLEDLVWEREYRPVDTKVFPFRRTVAEFLKTIDEEVLVPYNLGACQSMKDAQRLLAPNAIGFSSFDAGTVDHHVLNDPDKPCYTVQGGQFSFMVNFQLMEEVAKHLGIRTGVIESQREYVGRSLSTNVLSVMDLLASHPSPPEGHAWQLDALIVRTLQALNRTYRSPYLRHIEFPLSDTMPAQERAELDTLVRSFPDHGVPDTIAYLTEAEIWKAMPELEKLGYDAEGVKTMLQLPPQPVDYIHMFFTPDGS